jgi:hypothetical protein
MNRLTMKARNAPRTIDLISSHIGRPSFPPG